MSSNGRPYSERFTMIREYLEKNKRSIFSNAANGVDEQQYIDAMMHAINDSHLRGKKSKLEDCTDMSLKEVLTESATLGLMIGDTLGHAFAIPRWDKELQRPVANFQHGYLGILKLIHESPLCKGGNAEIVHDHDGFKVYSGTKPRVLHAIETRDRGEPIGCYAIIWLVKGPPIVRYMPRDKVQAHRTRFADKDSFAWNDKVSWVPMWRKTVLMEAAKFAPLHARAMASINKAEREAVEAEGLKPGDVIDKPVLDNLADALAKDADKYPDVDLPPSFATSTVAQQEPYDADCEIPY